MNWVDVADLRKRKAEHARAALNTPGVCHFCSGPDWQLPSLDHLFRMSQNFLVAERNGCWITLGENNDGSGLLPFEPLWGFASPVVGPPDEAVDLFYEAVTEYRSYQERASIVVLMGLNEDGELLATLRERFEDSNEVFESRGTGVMIIDLEDGLDEWLDRRSKKFRRSLHAAEKHAEGVEIIDVSHEDPQRLYDRMLDIQKATYKWKGNEDIFQDESYAHFYFDVLLAMHADGSLRLLIAQRDGVDLAHIFGAVVGTTYRGLQMSYRDEYRSLGLGNYLQWENMQRRAEEGVTCYNLGMPAPYKERWADYEEEHVNFVWEGDWKLRS